MFQTTNQSSIEYWKVYDIWSINQMEEAWRGCFLSLPTSSPLSWPLVENTEGLLNLLDPFTMGLRYSVLADCHSSPFARNPWVGPGLSPPEFN